MPIDAARAKSLFLNAAALAGAAERAAFLDRECGGDAELRARVEALLRADEGSPPDGTHIFESPDGQATISQENHPAPFDHSNRRAVANVGLGEVIAGKYTLCAVIGEGGMGSVYLASQTEPVKRQVALKLIKTGMDSKGVLARFDAERQALALMDHPNIARIYDGGVTPVGQPFFVMELVKGMPLTEYCDSQRLSVDARLQLFVQVCNAVQHAHQKGIIHRDLKPGNVLVTEVDGRPTPKVIDFGVAKATELKLTDLSFADTGAIVGTPAYMSPEQADPSSMDIDTRTDVYALGVILYELLTGSPPIDSKQFKRGAILEMLRMVREVEPPRPSTRLSTADTLPNIASNRDIEPAKLTKLLKGELDWIVLKALEKDRNRRYDTANGFGADVLRYLAGEQVQAVPPSASYRLRKWVRKNRGLVAAAGLLTGALTVGFAGTTWGLIRAEREAERARIEEQKVRDEQGKTQAALNAAQLNLVQSYLRPIGFNASSLDRAELIALDEVARQEDDRVKLLFLHEALADGERGLRIARRAERVVQAAVGTSPQRRTAALQLMSEKQRDMTADPRVRVAACWMAIELGSEDLPALGEAFDTLMANKVTDWDHFAKHLSTKVKSSKSAVLFEVLLSFLSKTTDKEAAEVIGVGLAVLAPQFGPATTSRAFDALLAFLSRTNDGNGLLAVGDALTALVPSLDRAAAGRALDGLVAVINRTTDWEIQSAAIRVLEALAPRLDPASALRGCEVLTVLIGKATDWPIVRDIGKAMMPLTVQLDPAIGQAKRNEAAHALIAVIKQVEIDSMPRTTVGVLYALTTLAPRLEPAVASQGFDAVGNVLTKATIATNTAEAGNSLVALASQLDAAAASRGFEILLALLGKSKDRATLASVGEAMTALAPRLEPSVAAKGFDALLEILANQTDLDSLIATEQGLVSLSPRLDRTNAPAKRAKAVDALIALLNRSGENYQPRVTAYGLAGLAPDLDPASAGKASEALIGLIGKTSDGYAVRAAAKGVAALSSRLAPATAQAHVVRAVDALMNFHARTPDRSNLQASGDCLAALTDRLEPVTAQTKFAHSADILIAELGKSPDIVTIRGVAEALAAMVPRLGRATAQVKLGEGVDALLLELGKTTNPGVAAAAKDGLVTLIPHLDTANLTRLSEALLAHLGKATDWTTVWAAAETLKEIAPWVDPTTAGRAFDSLSFVVGSLDNWSAVREAGNALAAFAPRLDLASRPLRCFQAFQRYAVASRTNPTLLPWESNGLHLLRFVDTVPPLVELLLDPGCVAELQTAVLARLEELAFPEPTPAAVYFGLGPVPHRSFVMPAVQIADDFQRHQNRRFRTVSDAASWIAERYPNLNLDQPYQKAQFPAK